MREESDTPDVRMARIAARQHGVVTAEQLREVGVDKSATTRRVKASRLHCLHRGVYASSRQGIRVHRCPSLVTRRHRTPVTSIQRAIDDLDGSVPQYLVAPRDQRQARPPGGRLPLARSATRRRGRLLHLRQRGFTVLRFAGCQVEEEPARVVADVARALAQEVPSR